MDKTMETFLQIGIVGTALSFLIQWIKIKFGTDSMKTKGITILLSVFLGAVIYFLAGTTIWLAIVGVLTTASTVFAFFLKSDSTPTA